MNKFIMMCGIPASGKSRFASYLSGVTVSRDAIRKEMVGGDVLNYFSKEKEVFQKFVDDINSALAEGKDVVADATHINENSRRKVLNAIAKNLNGVRTIIVFMDIPLSTCLKRNFDRTGFAYVPEPAVINMFNSLTVPSIVEGFDEVHICKENGELELLESKGE